MHFLIDADSIIYKAGCANEERFYYVIDKESGQVVGDFAYKQECYDFVEEQGWDKEDFDYDLHKTAGPLSHSLSNAKTLLEGIVSLPQCEEFQVFIGGQDNYRKRLYKPYKANRKQEDKPLQEQDIRDYLFDVWNAQVVHEEEVDDRIGILMDTESKCCVSIDKDLDNVPGWHYNYDYKEFYFVTQEEATRKFYEQLLSGDSTDNIPGVKGIGKKKAAKILQDCEDEEEMCQTCFDVYKEKEYNYDYFLMNAQLIWIRQQENEFWQPPINLQ